MANLLITGPLGHIGSWLIHNLSFQEYQEVILVDDLSSQRYPSLFNLPSETVFRFIPRNIVDDDLTPIIDSVDVVIHLAAITDAASSIDRQTEFERVNFVGTKKIAETCISTRTKLLFPSTTSVYGSQKVLVDETCSELHPQSPYAEAKLKSEEFLNNQAADRGLKFSICRFGTIFGISPGMRFHTAVNKFCWQAVIGEPLTVWMTALDQYRPYLGVRDCGLAIQHILQKDLFNDETFNVVSANHTVKEVTDEIRRHMPKLVVDLVHSRIMNQLSYHVSGKKFENTGWSPTDELAIGISETINLLKGFTPGN